MASRNTESLALLTDLYLKQEPISSIYGFIGLPDDQGTNLVKTASKPITDKKIYSFAYIPNYLKTVVSDSDYWTERVFPSVSGYSIRIDDYATVEDYLKAHLKSRRKAINRALRRLETCFDISYKMFQKDITEEEYHFLMERLKSMIVKRFEQRDQKSNSLAIWDKVLSTSLQLIKQGKASIYVIYDKERPIEISFNYNYDTLLFSYISSYDIDYAKFSLGQIEIYKQLEWCIDNGYTQFEMGWGDLAYKRQWSNVIYQFNHHIFYPKHSFFGFLYALRKGNRTRILALLIAKGVNTRWHKIKKKLTGNQGITHYGPQYTFETVKVHDTEPLKEIDWRKDSPIDKQIIYDFLFLTQEHSNDISLYCSKTEGNYILSGKKESKEILLNQANL